MGLNPSNVCENSIAKCNFFKVIYGLSGPPILCFESLVLEMSDDLNLDVYFPQFGQYLLSGDDAQAFTKLCAVGAWEKDPEHALEASLCKQFGIKKQADWPVAPLALIGEEAQQADGYWFVVHPVHFVLQRDYFTLGDAVPLNAEESELLAAALNQHFAQDGLRFLPSKTSDFLYLHVNDDVDVTTYSLSEAMGRDVGKHMPHGKHGMKFQTLLNEVQMLLHDHPINQSLEKRGLLAVNSLWLSGGGRFEAINQSAQKLGFKLFANDALSAGLAKWSGVSSALVKDYASLKLAGDVVMVLAHNRDLESDWFGPMLKSLKQKELNTLRCHFDVHGMTFTLHLRPRDTWRFWRKLNPITSYFNLVNN